MGYWLCRYITNIYIICYLSMSATNAGNESVKLISSANLLKFPIPFFDLISLHFLGIFSFSFSSPTFPNTSSIMISRISGRHPSTYPFTSSNNTPNVYDNTWFSNPYVNVIFNEVNTNLRNIGPTYFNNSMSDLLDYSLISLSLLFNALHNLPTSLLNSVMNESGGNYTMI